MASDCENTVSLVRKVNTSKTRVLPLMSSSRSKRLPTASNASPLLPKPQFTNSRSCDAKRPLMDDNLLPSLGSKKQRVENVR